MARTDNLNNFLTDVANSIRTKTGKTDKIKASSFDTEIKSIETGGGEPTLEEVTTTITSNTTTVITPSEGYDGIGKATVITNIAGGSSGRIPNEYQEVQYIGKTSTSGSTYIDTKYKPTYNTKVIAKASLFTSFLCGEDSGWATKGFGILKNYSYFSNKYSRVSITNDIHDFIVSKAGFYVDDVLKDSFSGAATFTADYSLHIYSNNRNGSPSEYGYGNIYTFKIYEADILQRDFVPCYEKSTNNIGLYDLVTQKFYPTSGTGTWVKGVDVTPGPQINLQNKEITITKNGTTSVTYDSNYDGLGKVDITTAVIKDERGIVFSTYNSDGYPTTMEVYSETVPQAMCSAPNINAKTNTSTVDSSHNGFIARLDTINLHNVKNISQYAFYGLHPLTINGLNTVEHIDQYALVIQGNIRKFLVPNIREVSTSATFGNVTNSYSVWLGSSIYNTDYTNLCANTLWIQNYWKFENGQLVDSGKAGYNIDKLGYITCTYNKIFDVSNDIGVTFRFVRKGSWSGSYRSCYAIYDETYTLLQTYNSLYINQTFTIPENAKYLIVYEYGNSATVLNNDTSRFVFQKQPPFNYVDDFHINNFDTFRQYNNAIMTNLYIDLPRATVETTNFYIKATDDNKAKIICNDDEKFLTAEEFENLNIE